MDVNLSDLPCVSVVIPVYNVEKYLIRCLESVILQTYRNLEIILVDDGSTDNSGKICDEYAERDSRIKVIHKENGGLSDARNIGIKSASADYIAFIDSDDYVKNVYIQSLVEITLRYDVDIAICRYFNGKKKNFPLTIRHYRKVKSFDSKVMLYNWHGKYKHVETIAWNKLYKKALFIDNQIYYPVGYFNEDVQTTHLLVDKAKKIALINDKLYYYYNREESIINTISEKKLRDNIYSQNVRLDYFYKCGYEMAYERLAIKRQKQYMLDYFKCIKVTGMDSICEEVIELFNISYNNVSKMKEIHIWEKSIFFVFKYLYCSAKVKFFNAM